MLPYFEQPVWRIGPVSIHAFGVAVAVAVWFALAAVRKQFERRGLDAVVGQRLGGWMLLGGIIGAHLFSVLLYFPQKLRDDPWLIFRVWEDISSFGGLIGGLAGALVFFAMRAGDDERRARVAYLDAIAFVFPAALAIGRIGCALAHDHPGGVTTFPLAFSLESTAALDYVRGVYDAAGLPLPQDASTMGFHDLGLYEFLFLALVVVPLFAFWNRHRRPSGFYLVAFAALYLPVRFCLDMLRVADARYVGLTPAQWVAALIMAVLPFLAVRRRTLRFALSGAVVLAAGWACAGRSPDDPDDMPSTPTPPATDTPALTRTVILEGLSNPWDIAVAADGAMFFTERCRGLSVRHANGTVTRLFGTTGSALVAADLVCLGQSGMHGVALDPSFASTRTLYVYMTSNLNTAPRTNRVVRLVLDAGYTTAGNRVDIVTDIAFKEVGNAVGGAGAHSGGRVRFGPDGLLYITTGDNHNPIIPQSPTLLGGKVLRVTGSGAAAPGNAPPAGFDARIYTYGHRNVQGIAFRPGTGQPFISEHGPNHSDEVTALVNGGNGGWDPKDRPNLTCPDNYCGYAGNATTMPMTDMVRFPNAMPARWNTNGASQGMGPAEFLVGSQWRAWNGRLAVGIMGAQRLAILELDAAGTAVSVVDAALPSVRFRALTRGPDGNLYVATDAGEIWRVTPSAASP